MDLRRRSTRKDLSLLPLFYFVFNALCRHRKELSNDVSKRDFYYLVSTRDPVLPVTPPLVTSSAQMGRSGVGYDEGNRDSKSPEKSRSVSK